jgi:hypothetical protein
VALKLLVCNTFVEVCLTVMFAHHSTSISLAYKHASKARSFRTPTDCSAAA